MQPDQIEQLRERYTGKYVTVDATRPELARFAGMRGCVKTINFNGRALVQFEGPNLGWFDIAPEFLMVIESSPEPK